MNYEVNQDIWKGKGFGYWSSRLIICMIRCFECGKENYAGAVSSGFCAWCGHDANERNNNENGHHNRNQ